MKRLIVALAVCLVPTAVCQAASGPWSATWQLDKVKSAPAGASFIFSKNADGTYQYEGVKQHFKFRCDGTDFPMHGTFTLSCDEKPGHQMDEYFKDEGAQSSRIHRTLSADGKTMTVDTVMHSMPSSAPNNSTTAHGLADSQLNRQTYDRMGAGEGFVGAWKERFQNDGTGALLITSLKSKTFGVNFLDRHLETTLPLDGKDVTVRGTISMSVHQSGPEAMELTTKSKDKAVLQETLTITDGGRTLIDEMWRTDHPEQKQHHVYTRQ
ncbi:MAG: hypothetical protein ABI142_11810 [Bryocella sp.]